MWWRCFKSTPADGGTRTVYLKEQRPSWIPDTGTSNTFPANKVKTSKYTLLNFIPKNLFGQFRRIANFYFLCVAIIQLSIDSPVAPWTSTLPLIVVVGVTAAKQAYEDIRRHREDEKVNKALVKILKEDQLKDVSSGSLRVGSLVRVEEGQQFPCDILLLLSADSERCCSVNTVNLDGETNLKQFHCPSELEIDTEEELWNYDGVITCQLPQANLYDFKGRLECSAAGEAGTRSVPLGTDNLLLRGSKLVNTSHIYGCVIYTGPDTKLALNLRLTSNKFSTVEKTMNYYLIAYFVLLLIEIATCTVLKYLVYDINEFKKMWYLGYAPESVDVSAVATDTFSFLIIFNYIIPISLYVTLEVQKFLGAQFFEWDKDMRDGPDGEPAKCNTSDLNEELGQIQYLFTDKTGTLTENRMRFRQFSCAGEKYHVENGRLWHADEELQTRELVSHESDISPSVDNLLISLALCHTVQATDRASLSTSENVSDKNKLGGLRLPIFRKNKKNGKLRKKHFHRSRDTISSDDVGDDESVEDEHFGEFVYQANSPDEKALVEACQRLGVVFEGKKQVRLTVSVHGASQDWTLLQVLEFDSDRRRMSVVVRAEDGALWLLAKGADSAVLPLCGDSSFLRTTEQHLRHFATAGLRTLVVGRRRIPEKEYKEVLIRLREAQQNIEEREEKLRLIYDEMEQNLELLGATAVEDQLQDGVELTLESLRMAGIKVWVLTGDKLETAVNISFSCGHFKRSMPQIDLTGITTEQEAVQRLELARQLCNAASSPPRLTLDGVSAGVLLGGLFRGVLADLCCRCCAVLCCRMAPKQKAEVVRLVKSLPSSPVCAAIGDGANDVSMIQEAHLGIGIMGSEGRQAVRCSDFAFSRFRFLRKAILVHGRWYYTRVSLLVHYSFYKNVAFITPQLFYAFYNALSTQSVYDSLFLTLYNITFTSLPVIVYGLTEQELPARVLENSPHLYKKLTGNARMTWPHFLLWAGLGLWHAATLFFGLYLATLDSSSISLPGVQPPDLYLFGTTLVTACVAVVNAKLLLETRHLNLLVLLSMLVTAFGFLLFCFLYSGILSDMFNNYGIFWTFYLMFTSPNLLLTILVLFCICLLPDICIRVWGEQTSEEIAVGRGPGYRPWWRPLLLCKRNYGKARFTTSLTELAHS